MSLLLAGKSSKAVSWLVVGAAQAGESSPQIASVEFLSNGGLIASGIPDSLWYAAQVSAIGNDYEIYAEIVSGTGVAGNFDAWLSLSTNRVWSLEASSPGPVDSVIKFSIRKAGDVSIMHTGDITLTAEVVV